MVETQLYLFFCISKYLGCVGMDVFDVDGLNLDAGHCINGSSECFLGLFHGTIGLIQTRRELTNRITNKIPSPYQLRDVSGSFVLIEIIH